MANVMTFTLADEGEIVVTPVFGGTPGGRPEPPLALPAANAIR
jgi:hypothetical protein